MKNQFTLRLLKYTLGIVMFLNFSSCSDENELIDSSTLVKEQFNSEISAKGIKVSSKSTAKTSEFEYPVECSDGCINNRVLLVENTSDEKGGSGNFKDVNYQIWNTATQLIVQTTNNGATDKVEIVVNGVTYTNDPGSDIPAGQFFYTYFDLPEGYEACEYTLSSVKVFGGGPQAELTDINYGVYVYCSDGCEESFSYVDNGSGSYTFTYIPAEDMENVNIVFTFAQGVNVEGLDDWSEKGVTRQMEMSLEACETYSWTVTLVPNCSGNTGNSNVWTDFKVVNDDGDTTNDSKKNISEPTPNIVISCPSE